MRIEEKKLFNQLKIEISENFRLVHPASPYQIEDWKGEDILYFQDHLITKVKSSISEKWFYTYLKKSTEKLPRIDMLNLLSAYCGYKDWQTFKSVHYTSNSPSIANTSSKEVVSIPKVKIETLPNLPTKYPKKKYWIFALLILTLAGISTAGYILNQRNKFTFCFYDFDRNIPLNNVPIEIKIIKPNNESPIYQKIDSTACLEYFTYDDEVQIVINTPIHRTDTIFRSIKNHQNTEIVKLHTEDHILMLNYLSKSKVLPWKKRRKRLNNLIHPNATIVQVYNKNNFAVDILSKRDYIDLITTFTQNLKNIETLNTKYENGKLIYLKFRVNDTNE